MRQKKRFFTVSITTNINTAICSCSTVTRFISELSQDSKLASTNRAKRETELTAKKNRNGEGKSEKWSAERGANNGAGTERERSGERISH